MPKLLEVEKLSVSYNGVVVVKEMSFSVDEGEILAIVGESGSGKSTIIKAIMGLLDQDGKIESGHVFYKGENLLELSKEKYRKLRGEEIAFISQDCKGSLCPVRTIEAQLYEMVAQHRKLERSEIRKKALYLLEQLKLSEGEQILKSYHFQLSGGMNQRVGIMMAMLLEPSLLLADEPTSALDVINQRQVANELLQLRDKSKTGMILITHHIGLAAYMADVILVMKKGELIEYRKANELLESPEASYTKELLEAVPRLKRG